MFGSILRIIKERGKPLRIFEYTGILMKAGGNI
jgi:hypothetical protein